MSDKLHSIPKEAIHVTPKEFSRPELEPGNVVIRLNGLGVPLPGVDDFDDPAPELEDDPVPVCDDVETEIANDLSTPNVNIGIDVDARRCENFPTLNVIPNFVDPNELASPLESDVPSLHLNDVGNDADADSTLNDDGSEKVGEDEDLPPGGVESGSDLENFPANPSNEEILKPEFEPEPVSDDFEGFQSRKEVADAPDDGDDFDDDNFETDFKSGLEENAPAFVLSESAAAFQGHADDAKVDESFGNFADFEASSANVDWVLPEVGNKVEPSVNFASAEAGAEGRVPEFDDDDDDDFGDFDSADAVATSSTAATSTSLLPFQNLLSMVSFQKRAMKR